MLDKNFILPNYNGLNFINTINTIKDAFGVECDTILSNKKAVELIKSSKKVVLLLVDAYGYKFYRESKNQSKFLKKIKSNGVVEKLTSQFPSTTTAHITSVVSGKSVSNHGFFEWFTYEKSIDEVFVPFLYNYEGKEGILPKDNLFDDLRNIGVKTTVISPSYINDSSYSKLCFKADKIKGYDSLDEMFEKLIDSLKSDEGNNFYYMYYPNIDSTGHEYGMSSYQAQGEITKFLKSLDKYMIDDEIKDTTFIITADHGQMEIDMDRKIYLNILVPGIEKYMKTHKDGNPIVPVGYNRDMFLYIKEEYLEEVYNILSKKLKGKARVYKVGELYKMGVFLNPSRKFIDNVGNLVILPYDKEAIWWYNEGKSEIKQKGSHGGLTKAEMEIPLLIYKF